MFNEYSETKYFTLRIKDKPHNQFNHTYLYKCDLVFIFNQRNRMNFIKVHEKTKHF